MASAYTTFAYSHLKLSQATLKPAEPLTVEADVTNTGSGAETRSSSFIFVDHRRVASRCVLCVHFQRVKLQPARQLTFSLPSNPRN